MKSKRLHTQIKFWLPICLIFFALLPWGCSISFATIPTDLKQYPTDQAKQAAELATARAIERSKPTVTIAPTQRVEPATVTPIPTLITSLSKTSTPPSPSTTAPTMIPPTSSPNALPQNDQGRRFRLIVESYLKINTSLFHRPNGNKLPNENVEISKGDAVALIGKAKDERGKTWFRVIWHDLIGWIQAEYTDFPEDKLPDLRPPPACAKPLTTIKNFNQPWTNSAEQDIAILADLYRTNTSETKAYPNSNFQVQINEQIQRQSIRRIPQTTSVQLLFPQGTALSVGRLASRDRLSLKIDPPPTEELMLFTIIYAVPNGCSFSNLNT